jgi:tetratricopeptide (TPR) repeat protein
MFDRIRAKLLFSRARTADAAGRYDEAEQLYRESSSLAPGSAALWYNLGLIYKRQRRWAESLECNQKALALDGKEPATVWNTAIAATALGDWRAARDAWTRIGYRFPDGEGVADLRLGAIPIRVSVDDAPEVVWCERLDPVRARVRSVPTPESKRRYGDLVLNDGEPVGEREWEGKVVPVLNELALLEPSAYGTYTVTVTAPDEAALASLQKRFEECSDDVTAEDWTGVRVLCKQCSEATVAERPHHHHEHDDEAGWKSERVIAIAAIDVAPVRRLLDEWRREGLRRAVGELERLL